MQLTKTQTIALFLGSTQAASDPTQMLTAQTQITDVSQLKVTDPAQEPWLFIDSDPNYEIDCTSNSSCERSYPNHACADIYSQTDFSESTAAYNKCVNVKNCGNMANLSVDTVTDTGLVTETNTYHVNCWVGESTEAPPRVDARAMMNVVGNTILQDVTEENNFSSSTYPMLFLTAKDQFMGGYWRSEESISGEVKWYLTPKLEIEECVLDTDCATGQRCAWWPDQNNKRCQLAAVCGAEQTLPPFENWTPTCDGAADNGPPISAQDDLANKALAKAESAIEEFAATQLSDAKTAAKYDEMTDEQKETWDQERATQTGKRDEFDAKLRTDAGYADLSTEDKNIFESELLIWKKAVYEACKADEKSIECKDFEALKEEEETRRNTDGFYSKDAEAREAFTEAGEADVAQKKAALTAAFMESNKPAAGSGEEGADCKGETATCADTQCCGVSTPKGNAVGVTDGQLDDICVDSTTKVFTDGLGREYKHLCDGAKALLASASALVAAVYLM